MSPPLIEMRAIAKTFGAVVALRRVDLTIDRGEVLGLVGDNAAGKSTLMKVLSGAYTPDAGEIRVAGHVVRFDGPIAFGWSGSTVKQAPRLCSMIPVFSVAIFDPNVLKSELMMETAMRSRSTTVT